MFCLELDTHLRGVSGINRNIYDFRKRGLFSGLMIDLCSLECSHIVCKSSDAFLMSGTNSVMCNFQILRVCMYIVVWYVHWCNELPVPEG